MSENGGKVNLDAILPAHSVKVDSDPESVRLKKLGNERVEFVTIAIVAAIIIIFVLCFLAFQYNQPTTSDDLRGKIVIGFIAVLSGAVGVFAGKKI